MGGEGGGHSGPKSLILAPQDIPDISGHQLGFGCQCVKAYNNENHVTNQKYDFLKRDFLLFQLFFFLQRLDSLPVTKKKGNPKSLTQVCFNSISPSFSNSIALFRRRRRAGLFSTLSFFFCNSNFSSQMKKKSLQKPSKKMDKMYKKMLEKQRLQKKREKYEKLHKKTKKQVP